MKKIKIDVQKIEEIELDIESCPFCGNDGVITQRGMHYSIGCSDNKCIAHTNKMSSVFDDYEEMITLWNNRVIND